MIASFGLVAAACAACAACAAASSATPPARSNAATRADVESRTIDARDLERFVDSVVTAHLARTHLPGAAFAFVQGGRTLVLKGYGVADVASGRRVSAESTIFRIGSISKVFTATALVQLADRGRLDMTSDVNLVLRRVRVPDAFGAPVTAEQLLDHTAGFDEIRPGTQAASPTEVLTLAEFLRGRLVRVRPPGETISYSTYGVTLAGELLEEVSGLDYQDYLTRNVWAPLRMTRTNVAIPTAFARDVAVPYEVSNGAPVPAPWEWYHTTPASSVNTTAADMSRFLLAQLNDGELEGARILSPRATRYMQRQHATMHPRLPGFALGFYEDYVGDLRVLEHGGQVAGFSSLLLMIPEERAGFFVVSHGEQSTLRDELKYALLTRYFPRARTHLAVPPAPPNAATRAERFAGRYAWTTSCHSCGVRAAPLTMTVTANADGTLGFSGRRWIEAEPLLFVRDDGSGYIAFRADSAGRVTHMSPGSFWSFERLPP
jgi:CubicO group peptidase (beta-lactamase class C family)